MNEQFLLLRTKLLNGRLYRIHCFGELSGRIWCSAIAEKGTCLCDLSLIEGLLCEKNSHRAYIQNPLVLDTFSEKKSHPLCLKSIAYIGTILEKNLPLQGPAPQTFSLVKNLLTIEVSDWKLPPALLALHFFEQEGIDINEFHTPIPNNFLHAIQTADSTTLCSIAIEEPLFKALLEQVHIF